MPSFVFQGSSGRSYTYSLFVLPLDAHRLPLQGANYILAAGYATDPQPIWIECARSLRQAIQAHLSSEYWATATDVYGVKFLYANFDAAEDARSRLAQKIDLIDRYAPPMNRNGETE